MQRIVQTLLGLGEVERHRHGVRIFRVVLGITILYQVAIFSAQYALFFGSDGVYPPEELGNISNLSYFGFSASSSWQVASYTISILVAWLWTIGRGGFVMNVLMAWAVHSFHARVPGLWDGGDNAIEIILVYAIALNVGSQSRKSWVGIALHNTALLACALQIALIYFTAGLAKIPGQYWQNGTAFYYVLASQEFGNCAVYFVERSVFVLAALTWAPVVMQLAFPWLVFFGRPAAKRAVVALAIMFHIGIFVLMGLTTFAVMMIAVEMLLLSDRDFEWLESTGRSLCGSIAAIRRSAVRGS